MSRRPQPVPTALLCVLAASLPLTACGGGTSTAASSTAKLEEESVKFARCLREHGVEVSTSGGPAGALQVKSTNPQAMESAQNACRQYRPKGAERNASPAEKAAHLEAALKFARCMRSHGVNIPDPTTSGGGISIRAQGGPGNAGGPNPSSPTFQAAQNACQGLLGKNLPKLTTSSAKGGAGGSPGAVGVYSVGPAGG
jgi:hypothetical protein